MTHEILTPDQMRQAEAMAIAGGIPSLQLMENAGSAVTAEILNRYKKCALTVLCGPGNNGGDGFVVARLLAAKKWPVNVYLMGELKALKGDADVMAKKWKGPISNIAAFKSSIGGKSNPGLIVDAIFGIGLNRDFDIGVVDDIIRAEVPVIAIDVPSGVDGATGEQRGCSVIADLTVTFFRKKPAHVLLPGRTLCGEIVVADIGISECVADAMPVRIYENIRNDLLSLQPEHHKFHRGHAFVWSGPEFSTGAARLAALAAARCGAGLTTILGSRDALRVHANHVSSIMLRPVESLEDLQPVWDDNRQKAFCIGPAAGINDMTRKVAMRMLKTGFPVVLDADALTVFAHEPEELFQAIKAIKGRPVVLTPHEGEFERLFKNLPGNKIQRTQMAAKVSGAAVVLKGADTVIAIGDGYAHVNTNAPPKLATAGSGDVLAGIITSWLAQGYDEFMSACAGVWQHGDAANRCNKRSIIAEDLIAELGD